MADIDHIDLSYGEENIVFIDAPTLFDRIPYFRGYTKFLQINGDAEENENVISIDLSNIDLDIGARLWKTYIVFAATKLVVYNLGDMDLVDITKYADLLMMGEYLRLVALDILRESGSIRSVPVYDGPDECRSMLRYFSYLVDTFDGKYDELIDAVAGHLACKQSWRYPDALVSMLGERHLRRLVKRKTCYSRAERDVYRVVKTWVEMSQCEPSIELELLLCIPTNSESLKRELDDCINRLIRDHAAELQENFKIEAGDNGAFDRHQIDLLREQFSAITTTLVKNSEVEVRYGERKLVSVDRTTLFDRIPYLGGYTRFQQNSGANRNSDVISLDLSNIDLDIDEHTWRVFMMFASSKFIFVKFDAKYLEDITMYADLLMMSEFLRLVAQEILQHCGRLGSDDVSVCYELDECRSLLRYFVFLVDMFDGCHDDLIDAVASHLASKQSWRYPDEIGSILSEKHVRRLVRRKKKLYVR